MTNYDPFAKDFSQTRQRPWPEFDYFIPTIKNNSRLLDLGCGNGRLRHYIPPNQVRLGDYFGFDLSQELLEDARNAHPRDHFFRGNFAEKFPFGAENFDWVVSIAAFHHLTDKQSQQIFLEECYRVLKPGGKLFLTTWVLPKKYFWKNFWKGRVFSKNWEIPFGEEKHPRIYRQVTHKDLKKLLKKHDFRVDIAECYKTRNYVSLATKI